MRRYKDLLQDKRIKIDQMSEIGGNGWVKMPNTSGSMVVVFSWHMGWDHVSISYADRTPTWDEMCYVKDLFFDPEDCVIQYHPARSEYVNVHPYCLHLWKPRFCGVPIPPKQLVL